MMTGLRRSRSRIEERTVLINSTTWHNFGTDDLIIIFISGLFFNWKGGSTGSIKQNRPSSELLPPPRRCRGTSNFRGGGGGGGATAGPRRTVVGGRRRGKWRTGGNHIEKKGRLARKKARRRLLKVLACCVSDLRKMRDSITSSDPPTCSIR